MDSDYVSVIAAKSYASGPLLEEEEEFDNRENKK